MQREYCIKKSATARLYTRSISWITMWKQPQHTEHMAQCAASATFVGRDFMPWSNRRGIYETSIITVRTISNITPPMVAAKCHHHFSCAFCVTCARHETKSLFWFRFRFLPHLPCVSVYHVPTAIVRFNFSFSRPLFWCHVVDASQKIPAIRSFYRKYSLLSRLRLPNFQFDSIFSSSPIRREAKQTERRERRERIN